MRGQVDQKKSWWSALLRPSWFLLLIVVIAFSYFAFTWLAPWQLGKDDAIVERNHQLESAFSTEPVLYQDVFNADGSIDPDKEWTRVTVTGQYLSDSEVLLRLRPVGAGPAYQSLVPFQTDQGDVIVINRGWIRAGEANAVPEDLEPAPTGELQLSGMVRKSERIHANPPIERDGYHQVYSINPETISDVTGLNNLNRDYIQLEDNQPGVLTPIPVPSMDRGNHLSYGYQWIAFGIIAPLGLGYFIFSEIRERRRAEAEQAQLQRLDSDASGNPAADDHEADSKDLTVTTTDTVDNPTESSLKEDKDGDGEQKAHQHHVHEKPAAPSNARRLRSRYGDAHPDYYAKFIERSQDRA